MWLNDGGTEQTPPSVDFTPLPEWEIDLYCVKLLSLDVRLL